VDVCFETNDQEDEINGMARADVFGINLYYGGTYEKLIMRRRGQLSPRAHKVIGKICENWTKSHLPQLNREIARRKKDWKRS
jgi:hypothetical protein